MAKSKSTSKRAPRARLSQSDKISKRLRGIKSGVGIDLTKAVHTVNVYAKRVPVTVNGFLVAQDSTGVVFRHKKTNASKKTRITTFLIADIIKVFGRPGEPSSITVMRSDLMYSVTGFVKRNTVTGTITVKDSVTGEITTLFPNDAVHVEVFADEDEKVQKKHGGKSKKASAKAPVDEEEEDFDDEDDEEEDEDLEDEDDEEEDDEDDEDEDEDDEDEDLDDEDL